MPERPVKSEDLSGDLGFLLTEDSMNSDESRSVTMRRAAPSDRLHSLPRIISVSFIITILLGATYFLASSGMTEEALRFEGDWIGQSSPRPGPAHAANAVSNRAEPDTSSGYWATPASGASAGNARTSLPFLSEGVEGNVSNSLPPGLPLESVPAVHPLRNEGSSRDEVGTFTDSPTNSDSGNSPGDHPLLLAQVSTSARDTVPLSTESSSNTTETFIETTESGFWLEKAPLNDVFQHLARLADLQYFHNSSLDTPEFVVTGELRDGDPVTQMQEVGLMFGLTIHSTDNTVYVFNSQQLAHLPQEAVRYQLKYLRPDDMEQTKIILQPFLTPGTGILEFETKTNTLVISDNEKQVKRLLAFLEEIDQPKQQIAIETRILRISTSSRNLVGVDWSSILGNEGGISLNASGSLNSIFGLPGLDSATSVVARNTTGTGLSLVETTRNFNSSSSGDGEEGHLVLSPIQIEAVFKALNTGGLAEQESSPTLITEDNEEGLISVVDRIPIITTTVTATTGGQNSSEEVRYKIDDEDSVGDPSTTREVGVTLAVTPTILPDGTIRMKLRPRSAQVVEYITSSSGNSYPRVNESSVTTVARVPNGHSLLIGGFYEEVRSEDSAKVPVFGDVPALRHLFKNSDQQKDHTSLVFIVTPLLYLPDDSGASDFISRKIHQSHILPDEFASPDPVHPDRNTAPNLRANLPRAQPVLNPHLLNPNQGPTPERSAPSHVTPPFGNFLRQLYSPP